MTQRNLGNSCRHDDTSVLYMDNMLGSGTVLTCLGVQEKTINSLLLKFCEPS
jgi:hypothetical protein